jgi:hypothetical protein
MAIVCRQCGRHNTDGSRFCANPACGAYLDWDGQPGLDTQLDTQTAAASLALSDIALAAVPGETASTTATVHNGGSQVEQFTVAVIGPAAGWAVVEPPTLTVYPGERSRCTVRFTPPRAPDTAPGRAWFTVRATSILHPGLSAGGNGTLAVGTFRDLAATLNPQGTNGRWRTVHTVELTNAGNVVEPVRVQATDPAGRLRFAVPAGEMPLAPGTHRVDVPVRPPLRLVGQPQAYPFQVLVTARPPTPPIRLDGRREGIPLVAGWVPKLGVAAAALAVAALATFVVAPRLVAKSTPLGQASQQAAASATNGGGATQAASGGQASAASVAPSSAPASSPAHSSAPPPPPGSCQAGYVWRLAFDSDQVCVTQAVHDQVVADNAAAASRWTNGAYGPDTCILGYGYVWREASPTDHVCVSGSARTQAAQDNAQATARLATPPKQCRSGYVWREAFPTDYVCVPAATRTQAASDNAQATARRNPTGAYGVTTCAAGYVWREARPVDHVCVTPDVRTQTAQDNRLAGTRTA